MKPLVLTLLVLMPAVAQAQNATPLVVQFETVFWRQFEIAKRIVELHDTSVLPKLEHWLNDEDRHVRGNAAFIFASLGDDRGFEVLRAILSDRSDRPEGQGIAIAPSNGPNAPSGWWIQPQIRADRYYAAHLFGDLKDARAVPLLVPLLHDRDINYIVPWALGQIGDKRAIPPLLETLNEEDASMCVLAIYALEKLQAVEALPRLRTLLDDNRKSNFDGSVSVAEAAKAALGKLRP